MNTANDHIFLFAGEASGDLHGSRLLKALKCFAMPMKFSGVGGAQMREEAFECIIPMEEFQVMGFTDVCMALPKLYKNFQTILQYILKTQPSIVILIDYPGFNLRLAKALRKKGFSKKIVQYICPSVWAHGKKRIDHMGSTLDLLLTLYPFEPAYFAHTKLPTIYAGNPLVDNISKHSYDISWKNALNMSLEEHSKIIALFPGSRYKEIVYNLPIQIAAAEMLKKQDKHLRFAISLADEHSRNLMTALLKKSVLLLGTDIFIVPRKYTYELMKDSHLAIATAGTVTLELALHGIPTVVGYHISSLNRLIAKYILRLNMPYYCIVNILLQKNVFPELISKPFTHIDLYQHAALMNADNERRHKCIEDCNSLWKTLVTSTESTASERAAKMILSIQDRQDRKSGWTG